MLYVGNHSFLYGCVSLWCCNKYPRQLTCTRSGNDIAEAHVIEHLALNISNLKLKFSRVRTNYCNWC